MSKHSVLHEADIASLKFAKPKHKLKEPRVIDFHEWAALSADQRAPKRALAMLELGAGGAHCVIFDTEARQPLWMIAAELEMLGELSRLIISSGGDGKTPLVVQGDGTLCPPYCLTSGITSRPDPGGGGGGGLDPGALVARAHVIERLLSSKPVRVKTETGEEIEAIELR